MNERLGVYVHVGECPGVMTILIRKWVGRFVFVYCILCRVEEFNGIAFELENHIDIFLNQFGRGLKLFLLGPCLKNRKGMDREKGVLLIY